ncbi:MAG: hypothetical protein FWH18_09555 [Marinilabiliaceae bacterium]|nr:hypothetical protein [Marinilabiliaceae bacterium]
MERLFKNKKEYNNSIIVDDIRWRTLRRSVFENKSDCLECKHFRKWDYFCKAYPKGIPEVLLSGEKQHREARADQKGTTIFEKKIKHSNKKKKNRKKIELSQEEIEAINQYLNGEISKFRTTDEQMRIFGPVIRKAITLMFELNDSNEIVHFMEWFWNKYQELINLKKVA